VTFLLVCTSVIFVILKSSVTLLTEVQFLFHRNSQIAFFVSPAVLFPAFEQIVLLTYVNIFHLFLSNWASFFQVTALFVIIFLIPVLSFSVFTNCLPELDFICKCNKHTLPSSSSFVKMLNLTRPRTDFCVSQLIWSYHFDITLEMQIFSQVCMPFLCCLIFTTFA